MLDGRRRQRAAVDIDPVLADRQIGDAYPAHCSGRTVVAWTVPCSESDYRCSSARGGPAAQACSGDAVEAAEQFRQAAGERGRGIDECGGDGRGGAGVPVAGMFGLRDRTDCSAVHRLVPLVQVAGDRLSPEAHPWCRPAYRRSKTALRHPQEHTTWVHPLAKLVDRGSLLHRRCGPRPARNRATPILRR